MKEDGEIVIYRGEVDGYAVQKWVTENMVPPYFEYNDSTKSYFTEDKRDTLFMFRDKEDHEAPFMSAFEKSSKLNKGKFLHAYLDIFGDA